MVLRWCELVRRLRDASLTGRYGTGFQNMSTPKTEYLFDDLPIFARQSDTFKSLERPIWSENKAQLIARYLYYFVLITRHGAYIDGFAARQADGLGDNWSAKLVLKSEPKLLRDFWLCDLSKKGISELNEMVASVPVPKGRRVKVIAGDFNVSVDEILASGRIKPSTATFCLLDQRTFECRWETVRKLANFKETNKIELFYFLGTGWMERALSAIRDTHKVGAWWGKDDWSELKGMNGNERANQFCERFRNEFGYVHVTPWPIFKKGASGRTMYHMIHCSDHDEAPKLMWRAYRTATKAPEPVEQLKFEFGL